MDIFRDISMGKKAVFILLLIASIVALYFLIFNLVYAQPGSIYKKNVFLIGLFFFVAARFTILFYKKYISRG